MPSAQYSPRFEVTMPKHRLTTHQNARTYEDENGVTYVNTEDALELARKIVERNKELFDRLADK